MLSARIASSNSRGKSKPDIISHYSWCIGNPSCAIWLIFYTLVHTHPETGRGISNKQILMANKADIVDKVHGVLGTTKADAERAVECVIDSVVSSLKSGDEVSIAGLGIFATKARPARQGRNPRTGETSHINASRTAKFRAAKTLKDAVK